MATSILIVDDNEQIRTIYDKALTGKGYEVRTAPEGEKALTLIKEKKPDLIILDIMMPLISGMNVLDIIKATPESKDIKVIILSALSEEEVRNKAKELGANDYIVKSETTMLEVLDIVERTINS